MSGRRTGWSAGVVAAACLIAGCAGNADAGHTADPSVPGAVWARIPDTENVFGGPGAQGMKGIAVGGPGLVAVGTESTGDDAEGAVWTSVDGLTWTRVPLDEENLGGPEDQSMRSVAAGGPGLVAVGSQTRGLDSDAAVWTSVDGLTWTRVPHDEAIFGGENSQVMNAVVGGGPGLVAVGWDSASLGWAGLDANAAVWTSPDGTAWTRVPNTEVFGDRRWQTMIAVTIGGPGLVAVGYDGPVDKYDAAVWTSADGMTWTRVPQDDAVFGGTNVQGMNAVTGWESGLVAVGYDRSRGAFEAAVWISADGLTWARVPYDRAVFGGFGSQSMNGVVAGASGLVAVGHRMAVVGWVPRDSDAAVWVTPPPSRRAVP